MKKNVKIFLLDKFRTLAADWEITQPDHLLADIVLFCKVEWNEFNPVSVAAAIVATDAVVFMILPVNRNTEPDAGVVGIKFPLKAVVPLIGSK